MSRGFELDDQQARRAPPLITRTIHFTASHNTITHKPYRVHSGPVLFEYSIAIMRRTLQLPDQLPRHTIQTRRAFATSTPRHTSSSPFGSGPAPPRLPKEEQEIFERLQRQSTGAFSTPRPGVNQSPDSNPPTTSAADTTTPSSSSIRINQSPDSSLDSTPENRSAEDEGVHPNLRRGAPPEFEGDVNPKTGEVGGPKTEPLRWGAQGDWSFNGRVTDF